MGLHISILETFILVSDLGSFSSAARKLQITQPAVSFQIKALEDMLEVKLLERSGGSVTLTPAGRTAYKHAKKIVADRDNLMTEIPRATGKVSGKLLICASTIPGEYILPAYIKRFKEEFPDVFVSLEISDSDEVLKKIRSEEAEIGFTGTKSNDPLIFEKPFENDSLVVIAPPGKAIGERESVTIEDVINEPFVNRKETSGTRKTFEAALLKSGIDPARLNVVAELGSTQAVINAVQEGVGISVVGIKAAERNAEAGLLSVYELENFDLKRKFYLVCLKSMLLSIAAEKFAKSCLGSDYETST
ncbi:MAG: selenium metabolism-associated LysR family transcriptional regulator [Actinomycetota bacterium]|nr:selenium metabolism-associated LysR family transcriptional regulator [Actinomycetota bacterium]